MDEMNIEEHEKKLYFRANMDYNISTKGSENMTQYEQLTDMFLNQNGIIRTSQAEKEGISKAVFYKYVKENEIEQISHGVYATKDAWKDECYFIHIRCEQAVFSHETASFFHDLTDREPPQYSITVKTGYNPSKLKKDGIQVYTVKQELQEIGTMIMDTSYGNAVPVYNMERTICDIIRSRSNIEIQTFQDALKRYVRRKDKNLQTLMKYADLFHVKKLLRQYLEVLL